MRIVDLLKKEAVVLNAEVSTKEQMLDLLVDLHKEVGNIKDKAAFKAGIMKRESEGPTAIAEGICIPHSKNEAVINPGIAAITVPSGVDCAALDGEPSNLFFMIAAPAEGSDVHLEALSRLSTILMDPAFREKLLSAKEVDAFLAAIDEKETEKSLRPKACAASTGPNCPFPPIDAPSMIKPTYIPIFNGEISRIIPARYQIPKIRQVFCGPSFWSTAPQIHAPAIPITAAIVNIVNALLAS